MAYQQSQQMQKEFRLPMVPGLSVGEEMMRRNYHRSQVVGPRFDDTTAIGGVPLDRTADNAGMRSTIARYMASSNGGAGATFSGAQNGEKPSEDLSGRVLRFYAFTLEAVPESATETERVRNVVLNYYLEDGTMSVSEPKQDNSGIAFRANLKRHIVPKPNGEPIVYEDLKIGEPISFYGRTYVVFDADTFTRDFFHELGQELPASFEPPADAFTASRNRAPMKTAGMGSLAAATGLTNVLTPQQVRATQQFLENDRKVLRCDCTWDDTENLYGYKHYLTLYFFLSDGSIALVEKDTQNSGRDPFPNFFSRQRIAKPTDPSGKFDSSTLGSVTFQENKSTVYYSDADIRIGAVLNLYGRKVKIHDYNQYTKEYMKTKFGITEYTPLDGAVPPPFVPPGSVRRELTAEEMDEKHKQKIDDLRRHRFQTSAVKFLARLDTDRYEDEIRRFVIAVFPADNSVSIFEPNIRNSGIVGGKFLQRQPVRKPNGSLFVPEDFFVGARVTLNSFKFVLLNSDSRSLDYMESNAEEFSRSDINKIVRKMQAMLLSKQTGLADAFRRADETQKGGLDMSVFLSIMTQLKLDLSEQEILTVLRFFDKNNESYVSYEEVAARVLPEGSELASDERPWKAIYDDSIKAESKTFVADATAEAAKAKNQSVSDAASRGAKEVLELYGQRRQLFMKEFHAITDYAKDSLIGVDEFKMCIRRKLEIDSISDEELDALCQRLFTPAFPRVTFEELMRLFNGTSSLPHTLSQIIAKTAL